MSTHLTSETLRRLHRRELASGDVAPALRHLARCAECTDRARTELEQDVQSLREAVDDTREREHLDEEDILAYADGKLDPPAREIVESHRDECALCRAEIEDLIAFRATQQPRSARRGWIGAAAVGVVALLAGILLLLGGGDPEPAPSRVVRVSPPAPSTDTQPAMPSSPPMNAAWKALVDRAIASGRLPYPRDLASLTAPVRSLRGADDPPSEVLHPAGIVVDETRPVFTWPVQEDATYVVSVFDGDREIETSPMLSSPRWQPSRPLRRGRTYAWQVEVSRDGTTEIRPRPPQPLALIRITDEESHRAIASALAQHPNDHLLHAVLYARAGLARDARLALRRAQESGNEAALRISGSPDVR
jgi:hypothetical protein